MTEGRRHPEQLPAPQPPKPAYRLLTIWSSVQDLTEIRYRSARTRKTVDRVSAVLLGGGYVAATTLFAVGDGLPGVRLVGITAALVLLYALAYRTEFVSAAGSAVATEPVLVAMLLVLPLHLVPLSVLLGLLAGTGRERESSAMGTFLICAVNGWHCLGPVVVLAASGIHDQAPSLAQWPLYLVALLSQFVVDGFVTGIRAWSHGVGPSQLVGPLSWTFGIDLMLAPIALCLVIAANAGPGVLPLLLAPVGLVWLLARDRSDHLEAAVSLNTAFSDVHEEARIDALTRLSNRRGWEEALDRADRGLKDGEFTHVLVIAADLDGLKRVNDTQGHEAGDALICAMADVLRAAAPEALVVSRMGGDEYGLLVAQDHGAPGGEELISSIREAMANRPHVHGSSLSASLGAAVCPPEPNVREAARVADARGSADKRDRRAGRDDRR